MTVQHGAICFIDEISKCDEFRSMIGKSIRISGRLDHHNCEQSKATITDPQSNTSLQVETRLIEPFDARLGALFQVIGELEHGELNSFVLKARIIRCVDGMDLIMYRRVVETQRRYLKSREEV